MNPYTPLVCALAVLTLGCQQESKPILPSSHGAATDVSATAPRVAGIAPSRTIAPNAANAVNPAPGVTAAAAVDELPPDVLVQVNDRVLKLPDAVKEVDVLVASFTKSASPQEMEQTRRQALKVVIEQFVANTLLSAEADRLQITLTHEEETNASSALQAMLPPGVTVEEAMRKSPVGEARFRSEMLAAAKIKKLLRTADTAETRVSDADFAAFTNQYRAQIEMSDSVRARHILVATKPADDAAEKEKRRQLADSIRTQLLAGADFVDMAKKYSDCPSKEAGGDLGRFGRRKMVKPFSDAAFLQPVNTIGDVVETQYGYHIIQVTEKTVMGRDELMDIVRRQKLLEHLAKSAKIKFNPPPQQRRAPSVLPPQPSSSDPATDAKGTSEVDLNTKLP